MNKQGFIFQGIWRWPLIKLATLIHGYSYLSYLISLKIAAGYRKLRSSMNPGQFEISNELVRSPRTIHAEDTLFQWATDFSNFSKFIDRGSHRGTWTGCICCF